MRTLTVEHFYVPTDGGRRTRAKPLIRLKGDWMKEAGISPGMKVNIEISSNQIIIKPLNQ